jgi:hypothetical protein
MDERGPMDPTPPLDEFLPAYEADDNEWWRAACGDHQNWFEEAVDRMRAAEAELVALRAALATQPQPLRDAIATIAEAWEYMVGDLPDDIRKAITVELGDVQATIEAAQEASAGSATPTKETR